MMELLLLYVGYEKKTFCRAFENVSKYPYCLNIHNGVYFSCLLEFVLWLVQNFCSGIPYSYVEYPKSLQTMPFTLFLLSIFVQLTHVCFSVRNKNVM